jgi:uncharacterized protein YhaN
MKILALDLLAFGPFKDAAIDLSHGCEGLHIVYGPNEAGKSSALRALRQLLFGIPGSSSDNFLHPYPALRIGAMLRAGDATTVQCIRRKGNKNTLRGADDVTVLDDSVLRRLLGGIDQATFESMFGLDHATLVRGGQAITSGSGEIGQILFAAGAGIASLRAVLKQLELEADNLFSPRARNPKINQAVIELEAARQEVRNSELAGSDWVQHDSELQAAVKRKQEVDAELSARLHDRSRLERYTRALPAIGRRREMIVSLAACADAPLLREDFSDERRDTVTKLRLAKDSEREATDQVQELEREIAAITVPEPVLANDDVIEELQQRLGAHRKALHDRKTRLEPQRVQFLADAKNMLRDLRPTLTLDAVDQLRLPAPARVRIQELANQYQGLATRAKTAAQTVITTTDRVEETSEALDKLEQSRDGEALRHAIADAQRHGDIEQQLDRARRELRELEDQCAVELNRLPLWSGTLEELERLPVPTDETIERFRAKLDEADLNHCKLQERSDELEREGRDLARQIEQLVGEQAVPSEDELSQSRRRREIGWQVVRRAWQETREDDQAAREFVAAYAPAHDLATAYEHAVQQADQVADRLRREADRVARKAELEATREQCRKRFAKLRDQIKQLEDQRSQLQDEWSKLWRAIGITPRSPKEMLAWLSRQSDLTKRAKAVRQQRTTTAELEARADLHRSELGRRLRELNEPEGAPHEGLAKLLGRAQLALQQIDAASTARRTLERDLARLRNEMREAQKLAATSEEELRRWHSDWATSVQPLGFSGDASPSQINVVLDGLTELFKKFDDAQRHQQRIDTILKESNDFERDVRHMVQQVAPNLAYLPVEDAAAGLHTQLKDARQTRDHLRNLTQQRDRDLGQLQAARRTIREMESWLTLLCSEAGCNSHNELEQAERRSVQRRELERQIREAEAQILEQSAGQALEEFIAEVTAIDPDSFGSSHVRLNDEIQRLQQEKDTLNQTIGREKAALEAMDGSARAAEAAEEFEMLLPKIETAAEQYARLRLAASVLRVAIERYREKNQGPILQRAGELFAELTLGSFEGLRPDYNEAGEAVLLSVRAGGKETVTVNGLSDGAADQLYLALRLASLETYLDSNEPLPFIADDLLVNFDNERAVAALKTLAELSRRTQVIFFTHHEHLVELARRCVPDELYVQDMAASFRS